MSSAIDRADSSHCLPGLSNPSRLVQRLISSAQPCDGICNSTRTSPRRLAILPKSLAASISLGLICGAGLCSRPRGCAPHDMFDYREPSPIRSDFLGELAKSDVQVLSGCWAEIL